jgi:tetratricopeptide (TPR) repeat protein
MARNGLRGRGLNYFEEGGYLLWRFWPDRGRLPFMTNAPELSSPEVRDHFWRSTGVWDEWRRTDEQYRFDWALLKRHRIPGDRLMDFLDADSSFVLVFVDDASALYVKRDGSLAPIARRFGYRWVSGGDERRLALGPVLLRDSTARSAMREELERAVGSSPAHASTTEVLVYMLMFDSQWREAESWLEEAKRLNPDLEAYDFRRGTIALSTGRPAMAVESFQKERRRRETPAVDQRLASALWAAHDSRGAVRLLERATRRFPDQLALQDSLSAFRQRLGEAAGR